MKFFDIFVVSTLALAGEAAKYCNSGNYLCFTSTADSDKGIMTFQVTSTVAGWVGIGFGNQMSGADIITMYISGGKGYLQDRQGIEHKLPPQAPKPISTFLSNSQSTGGKTSTFVFTRPLSSLKTGPIQMISAYSEDPVSGGNLGEHNDYSIYKIDLFSAEEVTSASSSTFYLIHGALMVAGWLFCTSAAVFIARFLKTRLGVWWFRWHVGLASFCVLFTVISFGLIVYSVKGPHFDGLHQMLGLIIFILVILQVVLGIVIDNLWSPTRLSIPWYDKLHWWVGRFLLLFALVNIPLGILEYDNKSYWVLMGVYIAIVVVIIGIFAYAQFAIGQSHHADKESSENIHGLQDFGDSINSGSGFYDGTKDGTSHKRASDFEPEQHGYEF